MSDKEARPSFRPAQPCALCGRLFTPQWPKAAYCSGACSMKAIEARKQRGKQPAPPKEEG